MCICDELEYTTTNLLSWKPDIKIHKTTISVATSWKFYTPLEKRI